MRRDRTRTGPRRRPAPAPIVDALLARILATAPDPVEALAIDQTSAYAVRFALLAVSPAPQSRCRRLVQLACGHFKVTSARLRAGCPRCGAMRRAGYDYDGFRRLGREDDFIWPGDPLRELHERDHRCADG